MCTVAWDTHSSSWWPLFLYIVGFICFSVLGFYESDKECPPSAHVGNWMLLILVGSYMRLCSSGTYILYMVKFLFLSVIIYNICKWILCKIHKGYVVKYFAVIKSSYCSPPHIHQKNGTLYLATFHFYLVFFIGKTLIALKFEENSSYV